MTHQEVPLNYLWNLMKDVPTFDGIPVFFNFRREHQDLDSAVGEGPHEASTLSVRKYSLLATGTKSKTPSNLTLNTKFWVEVTDKSESLELSFDCRGGGGMSYMEFQPVLDRWATTSLMLIRNADEELMQIHARVIDHMGSHKPSTLDGRRPT
jgi:hypothetical protein